MKTTRAATTNIRVYADETKTTILEKIVVKGRTDFITAINSLKERHKDKNLGCLPAWAQQGNQILADLAVSNLVTEARLMQKGII